MNQDVVIIGSAMYLGILILIASILVESAVLIVVSLGMFAVAVGRGIKKGSGKNPPIGHEYQAKLLVGLSILATIILLVLLF